MPSHQIPGWKSRKQVRTLGVSNEILGSGTSGHVYRGRLRFENTKTRLRVAVKRFRKRLTYKDVQTYERILRKLVRAGLKVAKTGFVKHNGEWVQVTKLLGNGKIKEFHLTEPGHQNEPDLEAFKLCKDTKFRNELVDAVSRIANLGYYVSQDAIGIVDTPRGKEIIAFDFDGFRTAEKWLSDLKSRVVSTRQWARLNLKAERGINIRLL